MPTPLLYGYDPFYPMCLPIVEKERFASAEFGDGFSLQGKARSGKTSYAAIAGRVEHGIHGF